MAITGEPSSQNGIFGNDLATMLDPNQSLYRLAQRMPRNDLIACLAKRYAANGRPSVLLRRMTGQIPKRAICVHGHRGKQMEGETRIITPATLTDTTGSTRKRLRPLLRHARWRTRH